MTAVLFTDTGGTVPADFDDDIARIDDLKASGNDVDWTQATAGSRPTLTADGDGKGALAFDADDRLACVAPSTDAFDLLVCARQGWQLYPGLSFTSGGAVALDMFEDDIDIVGAILLDRSLTSDEIGAAVAYYGARGASVIQGGPRSARYVLASYDHARYDPSDLSSLFQDSAGTVPVTTHNDPVGRMLDLSGNGYHMIQPTSGARPAYQTDGTSHWLQPDGTDDWMYSTATLALGEAWTHVGAWQTAGGFNKFAFTTADFYGGARTDNGSWLWRIDNGSGGDGGSSAITPNSGNNKHVAGIVQSSTGSLTGRLNGAPGSSVVPYNDSALAQNLALFTAYRTFSNSPFDGKFFGGVFAKTAMPTADIETIESWLARKTGVTL